MSTSLRLRKFVLISACVALTIGVAGAKKNPNPRVAPIGSKVLGKTYGEWGGAWWEWALQFPYLQNPISDNTGEDGANGQTEKPWFLAGTWGGPAVREVTIPAGRHIFFPLANSLWFHEFDGLTPEEAREIAKDQMDSVDSLECTVDGVSLNDLFSYRAASPDYEFTIPEGSILTDTTFFEETFGFSFEYPSGNTGAVADGYWIMLNPLTPGSHVIHFSSADAEAGFALDVTYYITVE